MTMIANRAHPASTLIDRFRPLQDAFATSARGSRHAGSNPLTDIALSKLVPGRSWGEIENSPCYPAFAGVGACYRRSRFRSSRIRRSMSSRICVFSAELVEPARYSPSSSGLQHVDDAAGDHVAGLGGVGGHVRRGRVRPQRLGALPFLDHDKGVGSEFGLKAADPLGVDRGPVFDAALLGVHRRYVGGEFLEDRLPHAGFGGYDRDDMDHVSPSLSDAFEDAVVAARQLWANFCRPVAIGPGFLPRRALHHLG